MTGKEIYRLISNQLIFAPSSMEGNLWAELMTLRGGDQSRERYGK